jgi:hypothetical protein
VAAESLERVKTLLAVVEELMAKVLEHKRDWQATGPEWETFIEVSELTCKELPTAAADAPHVALAFLRSAKSHLQTRKQSLRDLMN